MSALKSQEGFLFDPSIIQLELRFTVTDPFREGYLGQTRAKSSLVYDLISVNPDVSLLDSRARDVLDGPRLILA